MILTSERDESRGARIGRYVLLERLGAGGMGVVYAAWDPELDRRVAIKLIGDRDPDSHRLLRRRLRREAQAMAKLRHPNVISVYDVGEAEGRLFVAMEYVEGESLREWLRERRRSGDEILRAFIAAGRGLAVAHARGVVHRDFKADNVLVARDGRVLVLDFGLASWATSPSSEEAGVSEVEPEPDDEQPITADSLTVVEPPSAMISTDELLETDPGVLTLPGTVLGTPAYMSPEQRRGRPTDARGDQYSFCVALWEALSGRLPFGRGAHALARARIGRFVELERRAVPARVERALRRGLAWRADDRWPDMGALLEALEPPPPMWRRHGWWWAAGASLLAGAMVVGVLGVGREATSQVQQCEGADERVAAIWSAAKAEELAAVFASQGSAAASEWPYLRGAIDRWVAEWVDADLELCRRYGRGGVPPPQLECLDRQLLQLELALEVLASVSEDEVDHAVDLLGSLRSPQRCRETAVAGERAPALAEIEPERRAELERAIDRVALEFELSRLDSAEQASARLLDETDVRGLEDLHQRIAQIRADGLDMMQRSGEAVDVALRGLAAAERSGDALLRLRALIDVADAYAGHQDPVTAERWLALADALAEVLVLDRETRVDLAATTASVAMTDSRFDEALAAWERALAATDPETERLAYLNYLHNRATVMFVSGRAEAGLEQLRRCKQLLEQLVGPRHEKLLQLRLDIADAEEKAGMLERARVDYLEVAAQMERAHGGPSGYSIAARGHAARIRDKLGDCEGGMAELEPLMPLAFEHMPNPSAVLGKMLRRRVAMCEFGTPGAVEWAERSLTLYQTALGDEHVVTASVHVDFALALLAADQAERALERVERALAIYDIVDPEGTQYAELREYARNARERVMARR